MLCLLSKSKQQRKDIMEEENFELELKQEGATGVQRNHNCHKIENMNKMDVAKKGEKQLGKKKSALYCMSLLDD